MVAGRKLLLADDSITIQKVVDLTFNDEGWQVTTVSDGEQAIAKLDEIAPDVVLVDIFMPGLSGYQVCEYIKRNERYQHIPVMLLVGSFEPFNQEEARRVGADDVLTKPFQSIRELVSKVGALLSGSNKEVQEAPTQDLKPPSPPPAEAARTEEAHLAETMELATADTAPLEHSALPEIRQRAESIETANETNADQQMSETIYTEAEETSSDQMQETFAAFSVHEEEAAVESPAEPPVMRTPALRSVAADEMLLDLDEIAPSSAPAAAAMGDRILDIHEEKPAATLAQTVEAHPEETHAGEDWEIIDIEPPSTVFDGRATTLDEIDLFDEGTQPSFQRPNLETTVAPPPASKTQIDGDVIAEVDGPQVEASHVAAQPEIIEAESLVEITATEIPATAEAHRGRITLDQLSPEVIEAIARRAVEMLSERAVQEIAWEVVPPLAELLIKQRLEEENSQPH